jgi:phage shock protein PspC (stress-responsive transcriptional regulator)
MNEITKIHLGRQAFVIAVDAHKELQEYLRAIKKHMGDGDEAVDEVELRMAELLAERGISGEKVILLKDVDYLKEQLGAPGDFGDEEAETSREDANTPKRLFRDTENAMIAGVAAGIAKYIGIDPVWIRLAFIALVFAGASGILIYIILWLIVPEAKTSSERLQMQGKPVTVDALKDVVERADVKGAASRAQRTISKVVHPILKVILGVVGLGLMLAGVGTLLGLTTLSVYWGLNHDLVPAHIFPVGTSEVLLVGLTILAAAMISLFLLIAGLSVMKRKWRLPGWGLGAIVAVFLASLAISGALAADALPKITKRYEAAQHTHVLKVPEFTNLHVIGSFDTDITYEESDEPSVVLKYWGDTDVSKLRADVKDQTLTLDSETLGISLHCQKMCIFHTPLLAITVRGPKLQQVTTDLQGAQLKLPNLHDQTLTVKARDSSVFMANVQSDVVGAERLSDGSWNLTFSGPHHDSARSQALLIFEGGATIDAQNIDLKFEGQCGGSQAKFETSYIQVRGPIRTLTVNGKLIGMSKDLLAEYDKPGPSAEKCVNLEYAGMADDPLPPISEDAVNDN